MSFSLSHSTRFAHKIPALGTRGGFALREGEEVEAEEVIDVEVAEVACASQQRRFQFDYSTVSFPYFFQPSNHIEPASFNFPHLPTIDNNMQVSPL